MRRLPLLADLTFPAPGSRTARDVLSLGLGRLLADCAKLPRDYVQGDASRLELSALLDVVADLAGDGGGRALLFNALGSPSVGVLLRSARNALLRPTGDRQRIEATLSEFAVTLAFELWMRGALNRPLEFTALPEHLVSLASRRTLGLPRGARLTFTSEAARLSGEDRTLEFCADDVRSEPPELAGFEAPFHPLAGEMVLATRDNNPRAEFGAEPGEPGNPLDLGGKPVEDWTSAIAGALELVREVVPELHAEMQLYLRVFFPVGYHAETHRSASYRESIGAIYMTLHPNPMTLAEALIHEFSHNKLHAAFELDPIIDNDAARAFRSPLRPDPRPLRGVLLAVHAFLPVAVLYERMLERDHPLSRSHYFPKRFEQIKAINRDGAAVVLRHGRPTRAGSDLFAEIERWVAHFR